MSGPKEQISSPAKPGQAFGAVFRVVVSTREGNGQDGAHFLAARQMGFDRLRACHLSRLYFLQGDLHDTSVEKLAGWLLADPVTERYTMRKLTAGDAPRSEEHVVEVTLLPGVTDPPAENLVKAASALGITGLEKVATGQRFILEGELDDHSMGRLAAEILANPVIQRFSINQPISPPFFAYQASDATVEIIPVQQATEDELVQISHQRRLALNVEEMLAIRDYFRGEGRDPSDAELEMLAQTWSEHCVHKSFKAIIDYTGPDGRTERIDGLLKSTIRAATEKVNKPWVRSAFVDNAGIIAFDDRFDLAFKVETHNHPSALEPFGGANTGIGGVVRDVLGVSARPIANSDILCFGPPDLAPEQLPEGVLHPRRVASGVIHGIEDYGNKMGIPTVNGAMVFHPGYVANPLVYCGCLGILPSGTHRSRAEAGDLIIAIGGRTGRDGLRGATFSSMEMDVATSEIAGTAVQIGHPIQEKQVQEVVIRARDEGLYNAITDCGAGGFSSAVGEMGQRLGARVQLDRVSLKYPGLRPWEIWLSEAQERMVLAVPPSKLARLRHICAGQDVELIELGHFDDSDRLCIEYGDQPVGDLSMPFLHHGLPRRHMTAVWPADGHDAPIPAPGDKEITPEAALLALLAHPDVRSNEDVVRRYDHEVQGGTAIKPLVGRHDHGPGDATVVVPLEPVLAQASGAGDVAARPVRGVALSNGIRPGYGERDPYAMAWATVDEAVRNNVAVGADPDSIAILDNFCWGNPNLPDRLGALVRCAQGCHDAAVAYQVPFISGKDSLNNEYTGADGQKHAIPGTLLISAVGIVPDVDRTVSMDLKQPGNFLYLVGETRAELGGSHFNQIGGVASEGNRTPPQPLIDPLARYRAVHRAIQDGLVRACHDCSEGGLAVALAEMCIAGGVGVEVKMAGVPRDWHAAYSSEEAILFSESSGRLVVEVRPEDAARFELAMGDVATGCIGVIGGDSLSIHRATAGPLVGLPVARLEEAWRGHLKTRDVSHPPKSTWVGEQPAAPHVKKAVRVLILHANGTNRDGDAALACRLAGGNPEIVHINQLLAGERHLEAYHMLIIPGGFSYGDDLGAGALWALTLRHLLEDAMLRFIESGRPVLGICNGFQVLVKAGLLPGAADGQRQVTLTFNRSGQFECRWVYLQPDPNSPSIFTRDLERPIYCPVAHGEGRLAVAGEATTASLQHNHLISLKYVDGDQLPAHYPANPNGSVLDIAGICNPEGNVLGLMPHPENHIFSWQHPRRHRNETGMTGLPLFVNGIRYANT